MGVVDLPADKGSPFFAVPISSDTTEMGYRGSARTRVDWMICRRGYRIAEIVDPNLSRRAVPIEYTMCVQTARESGRALLS